MTRFPSTREGSVLGPLLAGAKAIPSLVQLVVVEIFATGIIGGAIVARILDRFGWCGHPPVAPLSWWMLVWLAVGLFFMWLLLRDIWNPGVTEERYSPVHKIGPVLLTYGQDPQGYCYKFLGSHPAYVLMDFVAAAIPLTLTIYSWGDDPLRNPTMHVWHWWLIVWAVVPVFRLGCWHGLRRGPEVIDAMVGAMTGPGDDAATRRKELHRYFWGGPLTFWLVALLFGGPALALGMHQSSREDQSMPVLNAAIIRKIYGVHHDPNAPESISPNHDDERFRIRGSVVGPLKHWPGGGGEKLDGIGFVVALEDGPEVAVFADEQNLKALERAFARKDGRPFTCVVRTLSDGGKELSTHFRRYYQWSEADLGAVPEGVKGFTSTGRRILTYYVDP